MRVLVGLLLATVAHGQGDPQDPVPVVTIGWSAIRTAQTYTVQQGDLVEWVWPEEPHSVTGPGFDSTILSDAEGFQHTFREAGTFDYFCRVHEGHNGTIIVTATEEPTPAPIFDSSITRLADWETENGINGLDFIINIGDSVRWTWTDDEEHSVTSTDGVFDSGLQTGTGFTFEYTFDSRGTFEYECSNPAHDHGGTVFVGFDPDAAPQLSTLVSFTAGILSSVYALRRL